MRLRKKMPTMLDVAKKAGVSQSTVSLVMNGKAGDNIPAATRERIFNASKELGYSVNKLASALNGTGSGMIGVLTDGLVSANFAGDLIKGAQNKAWENDKLLVITALDEHESKTKKAMDYLVGYRVEGIVYAAAYYHEIKIPSNLENIPTVLVNCYDSKSKCPCIIPADFEGAYKAAKYLLDNGHRHIIYMSNDKRVDETGEKIPATILREAGFKEAIVNSGLIVDESSIIAVPITGDAVYQKAYEILSSSDRPTAIMCYNDRMATAVYSAASMLNLRIPDDLSLIGYDNQTVIADFLNPHLTTIELPHYEMGRKAIDYLYHNKYPFKSETHKIMPKLIIRDSVKKIL